MLARISDVLRRIDGRGFKAYKALKGARESVGRLSLRVVRVQGDPFAPPSVVRAETEWRGPRGALDYPVALADWIARRLYSSLRRRSRKLGEGHSGLLAIPRPGPVMIRRSSVEVRGIPGRAQGMGGPAQQEEADPGGPRRGADPGDPDGGYRGGAGRR